ncbi:MAG TPA: aconitase family protein, partial [Bryobacteraceae bacterium]|nr:aconitase family protein [Bryobacteraceae bacterium]
MTASPGPRTLFEKIWSRHRILERSDGQVLLFVDRHLIHEGSDPSFELLRERGLRPRSPQRIFGTADHWIPTDSRDIAAIRDPERRHMVETLSRNAADFGITLFGLDDPRQGIVHVIGPEQAISQPGMLIVCGDSHTSTHGALGALAFGIGATEVAHVLATQTLWQRQPKTMRITVNGAPGYGVGAKDLILAIIASIGAAGATGHVIEYAGPAIRALSIEGRLTVCNMSIEAGARAGMVAPDEVTFEYLRGKPFAPSGAAWDETVARWKTLATDPGAVFDREAGIDAAGIEPMVTWGTSPQDAASIGARVPDPAAAPDPKRRDSMRQALAYMDLPPGTPLSGLRVDRVFIGSC